MALSNKIILSSETKDFSRDEKEVEKTFKGIRKIKPKFAPGMRFPCQE